MCAKTVFYGVTAEMDVIWYLLTSEVIDISYSLQLKLIVYVSNLYAETYNLV
jgi:hypothetical protein